MLLLKTSSVQVQESNTSLMQRKQVYVELKHVHLQYLTILTIHLPHLTCNIRLLLKLPQNTDLRSQQLGTLHLMHLFWTDILINLFLAICFS